MSPSSKRLKERKAALGRSLSLLRRAASARVDQHPAVQTARAQRRRRRTLGLTAVLLLLLLLSRCECQKPPPPAPKKTMIEAPAAPAAPEEPRLPAKPLAPVRVKRAPLHARGEFVPRGGLATHARGAPEWLEELRAQVSARSPRLAHCFIGAERPGALRWTASVNPASGWVSEHELEPVGLAASVDLSKAQRDCLVLALSSPAYRIGAVQQGAQGAGKTTVLPERISLLIEF